MPRQIVFLDLIFLAVVGFASAQAPIGGPVFSPGDAAMGDQIGNADDATPIGSPSTSLGSGGNDAAVEAPVGGPVTDQEVFGSRDGQGPSSGASKADGFSSVAGVAAAGAVIAGLLFS